MKRLTLATVALYAFIAAVTLGVAPVETAHEATAAKGTPAKTEAGQATAARTATAKGDSRRPASADASEAPAGTESHAAPIAVNTDSSNAACLVDANAVEDLRKRRDELDARTKELAAKEQELAARERALEEELRKIADTRDEIAKIEELRKKQGQERVSKLVETVEGMSPKASAQLLASIDETLAVAAISQISTQRLSKIMNVMEPGKSSRLSELLAGVARAKKGKSGSNDLAEAASQSGSGRAEVASAKGGERENGNVISKQSNDSDQRASDVQRQPGGQSQKQ